MKANNRFQYHFKRLIVTNRLMMLSYNSKGVLFPTIVNQIEESLERQFNPRNSVFSFRAFIRVDIRIAITKFYN